MSLTSDMIKDPNGFLEKYVMIVPSETDDEVRKVAWKDGPLQFKLTGVANAAFVELGQDDGASISAFFLPWEPGATTVLKLSNAASIFFTSQLTNCRFSVSTGSGSDITVAHTAGNISGSGARATAEKKAGFEPNLKRRLSTTGGIVKKIHDYRGQSGDDASSAFVLGQLDGNWKFRAQITEGVRNETKTTDITNDLKVLGFYSVPF